MKNQALNTPPDATASRLSRIEFYEQWAATSDKDSNIIDLIEDIRLRDWILDLVAKVRQKAPRDGKALLSLDLGCGTGRSICSMVNARWIRPSMVIGWDANETLLGMARDKCMAARERRETGKTGIRFECVDFSDLETLDPNYKGIFHLVVSSRALEHFTLQNFFDVLFWLVRPGGYALVSNVHPDMRSQTPLGFTDGQGKRFECDSYIHRVEDAVAAAQGAGFELLGEPLVQEGVDKMLDGGRICGHWIKKGTLEESERKWIGVNLW